MIVNHTVALETHGCKLNQADSQALGIELEQRGFRLVNVNDKPDIHLVNTCTVTHIADRKARHALRSAHRKNPNGLIVAMGCYSQRAKDEIESIDGVDLVFGNFDKNIIADRLTHAVEEYTNVFTIDNTADSTDIKSGRTRAMIKIQEGCNQVCAYCIVPKVRGREKSVPPDSIVQRINNLVKKGYKEVVLTGSQLGTYGLDIHGTSLVSLLKDILIKTDVPRLRVSSLQPQEITENLLSLWTDSRLCPHFHLALQSGSESILKRMRRRYNPEQYLSKVCMIRDKIPSVSLTTDVIVGFPGESDIDFDATVAIAETVKFSRIHVFPYSARPGTSATYLKEMVDYGTKSKRIHVLTSLSEHHAINHREMFIGSKRQVLWEEQSGSEGRWIGLTDNYIRVITEHPSSLYNTITHFVLEKQTGKYVMGFVA